MVKPELEKKLFSHLMKVEFSTLDEMIKLFQGARENLINIIESNTKTKTAPLGFILENMYFANESLKGSPHIINISIFFIGIFGE